MRRAPGSWVERPTITIHGKFPPETVAQIQESIEAGSPFGLTDGEGGVLFSPAHFASFEFGENKQIKSQDFYQDQQAFIDVVKMYLAFYTHFVSPQHLLNFPGIKLIEE